MTRRPSIAPRLALALALVLALGACGKRGTLRAPDDAAEAYTHPRVYPKPATVRPPVPPSGEPDGKARSREIPVGAGDLSPFPNRRTTTTYGDPAAP